MEAGTWIMDALLAQAPSWCPGKQASCKYWSVVAGSPIDATTRPGYLTVFRVDAR
jgi:hypothetical protein